MSRPQSSTLPLANARMYSATLSVQADWKALFSWVLARAGLPWQVIDYNAPAPLAELWARDDLGLVMMCGLPFAQRNARPTLLAAPIPSPARYGGKPVYFTDIVVRSDAPFRTLEDTFGGVLGYTLADSLSGGVALQHHLAPYRTSQQPRLYRAAVGKLINARGVIEALAAGRIDVGPLDSYYHDLLKRNDPDLASRVRVVASTAALPIPPLVATAALSQSELSRLQQALLAVHASSELGPALERLQLRGFALVNPADYDRLAEMARQITTTFEDL